jgi:hypothetical protein
MPLECLQANVITLLSELERLDRAKAEANHFRSDIFYKLEGGNDESSKLSKQGLQSEVGSYYGPVCPATPLTGKAVCRSEDLENCEVKLLVRVWLRERSQWTRGALLLCRWGSLKSLILRPSVSCDRAN